MNNIGVVERPQNEIRLSKKNDIYETQNLGGHKLRFQ